MADKSSQSGGGTVRAPVLEPIIARTTELFVWRRDDYPMPWSVWNAHPECEIHLIRHIGGTCHIGDHIGSFAAGDLYLIGRGLPHNWVSPVDRGSVIAGRDVIVQFDEDRLLGAAGFIPELGKLASFLTLARRGIAFTGKTRAEGGQMVEAIEQAEGLQRVSLLFGLLHLLSASEERMLLSSDAYVPNSDASVRGILRDVLEHIAAHAGTDIRLGDLAKIASMTESSFSRFFKKNTGTTFTRYLSELRMAKACELLTRTNLPITAICYEVGYDNLSNFNRAFLALRGMPPSRYRHLKRVR